MAQPEKRIENEILNFLGVIGVMAWKNQSVGIYDPKKGIFRRNNNRTHIRGVSDILGCFRGRLLAIEVKSKTGRLRPEQCLFIARVEEEGGIAFMARSVRQVIDHLLVEDPDNHQLKQFQKEYK